MNKKQKKILFRILITIIILITFHFLIPENNKYIFIFYLIPYFIIGYDIVLKAIKNIIKGQVFDENFLMVVATIGAFLLKDYHESTAVMLFYQIGEFFQNYAINKSRKNIVELMDIRPDYAYIINGDDIEKIDPEDVEIGSIILVKVGDKIPIDGIVVEGNSTLNVSSLTGESKPLNVGVNDNVLSGSINMYEVLKIKTTASFEQSTASKILQLVEDASSNKSNSERFITKFAKFYTPIVCISALIIALIPPLINLLINNDPNFSTWVYRALTFLVISCPCALVISIPLSFFGGIGGASNKGILIKGSNYLENLAKIKYLAFDKTGTMTKGIFEISCYHECKINEKELLKYAAYAESLSNHPIGISIVKEYGEKIDKDKIESIKEIPGKGIVAKALNSDIIVGSKELLNENGINVNDCADQSTIIYVAINNKYVGHLHIKDMIKVNSKKCINELKNIGIKSTIMLTGDKEKIANEIGKELNIDYIYSEMLPEDKINKLKELINQYGNKNSLFGFVGDGINDAPVINAADVGISMGALGSDAAIEAADIVLMDDDPYKIVSAIKIAKKCLKIVYENIYFAISIKVICLILGLFGIANMWLAIFADTGVLIISVLNALRALYVRNV